MPPKRFRCSVAGCMNPHSSLHLLPKSEPLKTRWINFVFKENAPSTLPKFIYVCANHFTDCFVNEGQYKAGFAQKLLLKDGAVPTVRDPATPPEDASTSEQSSQTRDIACQTDEKPLTKSVGTQLSVKTLHAHYRRTGVQSTDNFLDIDSSFSPAAGVTFMSSAHIKRPPKRPRVELEEEDDEKTLMDTSSIVAPEEQDSTFDPAETDTTLTETADMSAQASCPIHKIRKYIVYENCIMELFEVCPVCKQSCSVRSQRIGTFVRVEQLCHNCKYSRKWSSQPVQGSTPAGNLHISAAVYLCGASFYKLEKICTTMNLQLFKYDTFRRHSRLYIEPAIVYKWMHWQNETLHRLSERDRVIVGGDMRADSPGHSVKFGSYTVMDLQTNTVVDIQLVQSNEVGGRYHMEKEGLQRSLALLEARGVTLECIVTDRHPQIQKFLRERNIKQFYDVWRIEKGITRQLENICKLKDCEKLREWLGSIKNHIYWTAASSITGPERVAKWSSILNHVRDIHTHEDPNFPACLHPQKRSRDGNKWLVAGTQAFYKLEKVMTNKRILKDVTKLSPHHQTSPFDSFHSVILRFAPKNVVFPFLGMLCRLYLAALHYNENVGRAQATTSTGRPLFKVNFPKGRKGQCTVKQVKTRPLTFRYLDDLQDLIFEHVFVDPASYMDEVLKIPIPPDLCAEYERPDKEEVIMVSRLNQ
uniref:THAP-type domain-containing protein n=1 Tax=Cyprinus carpio carpio TaxID=630221 RepID=A0A9J8D7P0_CYPCA